MFFLLLYKHWLCLRPHFIVYFFRINVILLIPKNFERYKNTSSCLFVGSSYFTWFSYPNKVMHVNSSLGSNIISLLQWTWVMSPKRLIHIECYKIIENVICRMVYLSCFFRKVLLMGRSGAGKTSMRSIIFANCKLHLLIEIHTLSIIKCQSE